MHQKTVIIIFRISCYCEVSKVKKEVKVKKGRKKKENELRIGTWNVLTLLQTAKLEYVKREMDKHIIRRRSNLNSFSNFVKPMYKKVDIR